MSSRGAATHAAGAHQGRASLTPANLPARRPRRGDEREARGRGARSPHADGVRPSAREGWGAETPAPRGNRADVSPPPSSPATPGGATRETEGALPPKRRPHPRSSVGGPLRAGSGGGSDPPAAAEGRTSGPRAADEAPSSPPSLAPPEGEGETERRLRGAEEAGAGSGPGAVCT